MHTHSSGGSAILRVDLLSLAGMEQMHMKTFILVLDTRNKGG